MTSRNVAKPLTDWRPIRTAPRNVWIRVRDEFGISQTYEARWWNDTWRAREAFPLNRLSPTHWQPLE